MTPEQLKTRTKVFALRVIKLVRSLPHDDAGRTIGRQLLRSGTGVTNYRAACRSRTDKDFLARMGVAEEEADESIYWMELLVEPGTVREDLLSDLMGEADELLRILVASINTVKARVDAGSGNPNSEIRNPK